jgi:hypothetical protein
MPALQSSDQGLLSVHEAAKILNVSECWVRRHKSVLPVVRIGGLIRFDESLLRRDLACRIPREKPLKLRGAAMSYQIRRWQQGSVYKTGKRSKMWYGMWREEFSDADGNVKRRQRNVKLGPVTELPTSGNFDVARRARSESCVGTVGALGCFDHAADLRSRGIRCVPSAVDRGGKPVVMKLVMKIDSYRYRLRQTIGKEGDGERGRNRTFNLLIKSQLLCQLSYAPAFLFSVL